MNMRDAKTYAMIGAIMHEENLSRQKGLAPVVENDPSLPLAQQPAMIVHLGVWFGRKPSEHSS